MGKSVLGRNSVSLQSRPVWTLTASASSLATRDWGFGAAVGVGATRGLRFRLWLWCPRLGATLRRRFRLRLGARLQLRFGARLELRNPRFGFRLGRTLAVLRLGAALRLGATLPLGCRLGLARSVFGFRVCLACAPRSSACAPHSWRTFCRFLSSRHDPCLPVPPRSSPRRSSNRAPHMPGPSCLADRCHRRRALLSSNQGTGTNEGRLGMVRLAFCALGLWLLALPPALAAAADERQQAGAAAPHLPNAAETDKAIAAINAARAATAEALSSAPLGFRRILFVSDVPEGFADYQPRADNVFTPDEPLIVYTEPIGVVVDQGRRRTRHQAHRRFRDSPAGRKSAGRAAGLRRIRPVGARAAARLS